MSKRKVPLFYLDEELQIEPTGKSPAFSARLVGLKRKIYLLVDCADADFERIKLEPEEVVWVRYPCNMPFRFKSKVLNLVKEPTPVIFLEYPRFIEEINFRRSERKKTFIRGQFAYLRKNGRRHSGDGYILDLSDSGCLMWDDFVHIMDRHVLLRFHVPWNGAKVQAKAQVVRSDVTHNGLCSGLKFIDLDPLTQKQIRECVRLTRSQTNATSPT
jgi:hypothetical protein